jgi:hypothetical protein
MTRHKAAMFYVKVLDIGCQQRTKAGRRPNYVRLHQNAVRSGVMSPGVTAGSAQVYRLGTPFTIMSVCGHGVAFCDQTMLESDRLAAAFRGRGGQPNRGPQKNVDGVK